MSARKLIGYFLICLPVFVCAAVVVAAAAWMGGLLGVGLSVGLIVLSVGLTYLAILGERLIRQ
jgi:hypothetical protein